MAHSHPPLDLDSIRAQARGSNWAVNFSGGKDSLALLYALRPMWEELTVYWLDTGAAFPETLELISRVRAEVPHFRVVKSDVRRVIARYGWPSDVVPDHHTAFGAMIHGPLSDEVHAVQPALDCCRRTIMEPMWATMRMEGVTTVLRGKRHSDEDRNTGVDAVYDDATTGIRILNPLWEWTTEDVFAFLRANNLPILPVYNYTSGSARDCTLCTGRWYEGHDDYLRDCHPEHYADYVIRLEDIQTACIKALTASPVMQRRMERATALSQPQDD